MSEACSVWFFIFGTNMINNVNGYSWDGIVLMQDDMQAIRQIKFLKLDEIGLGKNGISR